MAGNLCRLCFEGKFRPTGIFGAKGVKLKIADKIRIHFPHEVKPQMVAECHSSSKLSLQNVVLYFR